MFVSPAVLVTALFFFLSLSTFLLLLMAGEEKAERKEQQKWSLELETAARSLITYAFVRLPSSLHPLIPPSPPPLFLPATTESQLS